MTIEEWTAQNAQRLVDDIEAHIVAMTKHSLYPGERADLKRVIMISVRQWSEERDEMAKKDREIAWQLRRRD
jgi:hypothetical protein